MRDATEVTSKHIIGQADRDNQHELWGSTGFQDLSMHSGRGVCRNRNTEQITEEFPFIVTAAKH